MRLKKCKSCGVKFAPVRPLQQVCSPLCAMKWSRVQNAKRERKVDAERAEKLMTLRDLVRRAQTAFNAFIRERDKDLPCISCGRHHQGQYHAGHYMSTGARPELRFDEANVHKQCQPCNTHLSGNLVAYRKALIDRIGEAEVLRLEGPTQTQKLSRDELIDLRASYQQKLRTLRRQTNE